jgi:hypothetical protein
METAKKNCSFIVNFTLFGLLENNSIIKILRYFKVVIQLNAKMKT